MATAAATRRRRRDRRIVAATMAICAALVLGVAAWAYGPDYVAYWKYAPKEGDIIFQSLPRSRLVNAIEGVSQSPYSHCGIVATRDGEWVVYESYRKVEVTPLREFIFRGRNSGFAVYRLKPEHQDHVPTTIKNVRRYVGRPYDVRYRMDDEKIYCSELIYKAYQDASGGQSLGNLERLEVLNWRPYSDTITHFEKGPVPLDRQIITPVNMAMAQQLKKVFVYRIADKH